MSEDSPELYFRDTNLYVRGQELNHQYGPFKCQVEVLTFCYSNKIIGLVTITDKEEIKTYNRFLLGKVIK
jgi:hypothetical protein